MKIERLSENQIRCTLYKSDLADKELLLTELAYGTDKAKELFRELMQQASSELGFEVDNIPLMIEAIPVSSECLILIITKVEDPDELDSRFSRFTKPAISEEDGEEIYDDSDDENQEEDSTSDVMNLIKEPIDRFMNALGDLTSGRNTPAAEDLAKRLSEAASEKAALKDELKAEKFRIYAFNNLDNIIISAKNVKHTYDSKNSLYKNQQDSVFYLYLTRDNNTETEFVKTCNLIGEYGTRIRTTYATKSHMEEHFKIILDGNALQTLAQL